MRYLLKCSIGKKITMEWLQNSETKEKMKLVSMELPAPELSKAYGKFAYVLHYICGGHNDTSSTVIDSISETHIFGFEGDETLRGVEIKASQIARGGVEIKIRTSEILESWCIDCLPDGRGLGAILDEFEAECFKYIDGCRAQQSLEFDKATEMAEKKRSGDV